MSLKIRIDPYDLEIPDYIVCLSQEVIDLLSVSDGFENKIIAAGVHPKDGMVILILGSCKIMSFDADSYYIPRGRYIPQDDGNTVFLPNENSRWPGMTKGFTVDSSWLIAKSESATLNAELLVNNKTLGTFKF